VCTSLQGGEFQTDDHEILPFGANRKSNQVVISGQLHPWPAIRAQPFKSPGISSEMAFQPLAVSAKPRIFAQPQILRRTPVFLPQSQSQCVCRCHNSRLFSSSTKRYRQPPDYKESFGTRLRKALGETKIKWYPIPVGLGIGFLGLVQFYKVNERERLQREEEWEDDGYVKIDGSGVENGEGGPGGRPKRRERIRPSGPWFVSGVWDEKEKCLTFPRQVQVMSTLPLKAISRLWGKFNELEIPYYLRVPGFKLYSFIFGVKYEPPPNLDSG
jgi:phosphatidylserine decarboxylase